MSILIDHLFAWLPASPPGPAARLHQQNCGPAAATGRRSKLGPMARQRHRQALRDLADDKHLLADIGLTREQALAEAEKPFWQ